MSICVLGAGGFLGTAICKELGRRNINYKSYGSQGISSVFDSKGLLIDSFKAPENCSCIIYLSQSPYYRELPDMVSHVWNVNVTSALEAAKKAGQAGVKRFIYASTGSIYQPSFQPLHESSPLQRNNLYALSKLHAEEGLTLINTDLDVTFLRIFGLYGPGQKDKLIPNLIRKVITKNTVCLDKSPLDTSCSEGLCLSLCHVDDAARIIVDLTGVNINGPINLASDEVASIKYITELIGESMGMEVNYKIVQSERAGNLISDITLLEKFIDLPFIELEIGIENILTDYKGLSAE